MKKLIVILGPNGVGKSTAAKAILSKCSNSAYVDADWCRAINPFSFTEETKKTVTENIFNLLRNYLKCKDVEMVIFPYGLHGERQSIFNEVIKKLKQECVDFEMFQFVIRCDMEVNRKRALLDQREEERVIRGIKNTFHFYDTFSCPVIDSTNLTPDETADRILEMALCL